MLNNAVKELKDKSGLTYQQMQDLTGVPARTLQNWCQGCREAPLYMAPLLEAKIIVTRLYGTMDRNMIIDEKEAD